MVPQLLWSTGCQCSISQYSSSFLKECIVVFANLYSCEYLNICAQETFSFHVSHVSMHTLTLDFAFYHVSPSPPLLSLLGSFLFRSYLPLLLLLWHTVIFKRMDKASSNSLLHHLIGHIVVISLFCSYSNLRAPGDKYICQELNSSFM